MVRWWERSYQIRVRQKKKYKLFFIRAESSHEPSRPQLKLGSFSYRTRLARAKLARVILARARLARARAEPELSHDPELFCATLPATICLRHCHWDWQLSSNTSVLETYFNIILPYKNIKMCKWKDVNPMLTFLRKKWYSNWRVYMCL
jgi:hypothetical protein